MKKFSLLAGIAAGLLVATAAYSADLSSPVEPIVAAPTAYDWTGFYIGVNAGYGSGEAHSDDVFAEGAERPAYEADFPMDGAFTGVQIGQNYQLGDGPIVVGGELLAEWSGVAGDYSSTTPGFLGDVSVNVNWFAALRGRVGFAADRALFYGTAGALVGGLDLNVTDTPLAGGDLTGSNIHLGYMLGAGVEYAITDNITVRGEYNYANFGEADYVLTDTNGVAQATATGSGAGHAFLAGASLKF